MKSPFDQGGHRKRVSGAGFRLTRLRVLVVLAAAAFMLLAPAGSYAVHDIGLLELDGNTVDNSAPVAGGSSPCDWESVFDASGLQSLAARCREPHSCLPERAA